MLWTCMFFFSSVSQQPPFQDLLEHLEASLPLMCFDLWDSEQGVADLWAWFWLNSLCWSSLEPHLGSHHSEQMPHPYKGRGCPLFPFSSFLEHCTDDGLMLKQMHIPPHQDLSSAILFLLLSSSGLASLVPSPDWQVFAATTSHTSQATKMGGEPPTHTQITGWVMPDLGKLQV